MATAKPSTLQISDLVQWFREKELVINDTFQRHTVWTAAAKTYCHCLPAAGDFEMLA
jgi:hypothetical protein